MKTISRTESFEASPHDVFAAIDDLAVTGMHMTKSSMMMMGSMLKLEFLSHHKTGLNSRYRWTSKMMGIPMDFTVLVTKWVEGVEKVWETVGHAKLVIYSWYCMKLLLNRHGEKTDAELSITYEKPEGLLKRILSFLLADWYCRWCLRKMLADAKIAITKANKNLRMH